MVDETAQRQYINVNLTRFTHMNEGRYIVLSFMVLDPHWFLAQRPLSIIYFSSRLFYNGTEQFILLRELRLLLLLVLLLLLLLLFSY